MKMMGRLLYEADERVKTENYQLSQTVYILAAKAKDGDGARMIVSDYCGTSGDIEIEIKGLEKYKDVFATIMDNDFDSAPAKAVWDGKKLTLFKNSTGSAAFYVTIR